MSLRVIQICDKCKKEREIKDTSQKEKDQGGWREFDGKTICAEDIRKFFEGTT